MSGDPDDFARDLDAIDNSPLRPVEVQHLRLILEQERARRRLARRIRRFLAWLTGGLTTLILMRQLGFIDWLAGAIIRLRH